MINVLISAYAVSPTWGSEPGMGWNWIVNIARYCNVYVITEGEWKTEILEAVKKLPQKKNIHFYFNPVSDNIRKMCWNQGDWRFYWYYRKWQKKTLKIAEEIISKNRIDVLHQLNMIGFREPGYLWKIKNIPLVWGPIGGMGSVPLSYQTGFGIKHLIIESVKTLITNTQIVFHPRVRKMIRHAFLIGAIKSVQDKIDKYYHINVPIISETGTYRSKNSDSYGTLVKRFCNSKLKILWIGRLIPTKRLDIALNTIAYLKNYDVEMTVCGVGSRTDEIYYKELIDKLEIGNKIKWLGKVDHSQISKLMAESDLFFMTSVAEATSTVVVEAISESLPILSFNICGFGPLVKEFAGQTIELTNPIKSAHEFAEKIKNFIDNPSILHLISEKEEKEKYKLSWDYKGKAMTQIYSDIIESLNI